MGEFFQGWRRKTGVVTFVLALVFMAGWVRSIATQDDIDFHDFIDIPYGSLPLDGLATKPHSLILMTSDFGIVFEYVAVPTPSRAKVTSPDTSPLEENANVDLQNVQQTFQQRMLCQVQQVPLLEIPFSPIVIPLTLISAFFLLSKPCPRTQKKITESATVAGT